MSSYVLSIDAEKLKRMRLLHVPFILVDVRDRADFDSGHIQGAINVESGDFLSKISGMIPKKDTPIVIYDNDGVAVTDLIVEAEKLGYTNIVNLEGGYRKFDGQ